jgi:hypothetical protein
MKMEDKTWGLLSSDSDEDERGEEEKKQGESLLQTGEEDKWAKNTKAPHRSSRKSLKKKERQREGWKRRRWWVRCLKWPKKNGREKKDDEVNAPESPCMHLCRLHTRGGADV